MFCFVLPIPTLSLPCLQTREFKGFKWILNYQDHLGKFIYLRPLRNKGAEAVGRALLNFFLTQGKGSTDKIGQAVCNNHVCSCVFVGAPGILQSDRGKEFVNGVIKALAQLWPTMKLVRGRPRHPRTQGSVERANRDVGTLVVVFISRARTRLILGACFCRGNGGAVAEG